MDKPKILIIASFPPPVHGSSVVSQQIRDSKIVQSSFDVYCVNISSSRTMSEIGKNSLTKYFRILISAFKILVMLIKHNFALCYCAITVNGSCFLRDSLYVLLCKFFNKKIVIHQHNKGMAQYVNRPIYRWLYPLVYKNAKVILLSWFLYDDISMIVDKTNCMVCYNGIPETPKTKINVDKREKPHLLFLSNLIESKGPIVLLEACRLLKEMEIPFHCDFVGGETKDITKEFFEDVISSKNLQDTVTYHGKKYGADKDEFWNIADIFVFPTYYHNECFPLVLLEAMEKGKACVSTDEGGIRDIIDDGFTGYIVNRKDALSLANAIRKLLENPQLSEQMGRAGKEKYEKYFTQDVFERNINSCLKNAL